MSVYVTNFAGHDYTDAKRYGEIIWVTKGYVSFQSLDRVRYQVLERIKDSKPDDWLCLSGTIIINVITAVSWFTIHKQVKLLIFDKKYDGKLRELVITEDNTADILEAVWQEK